MRWEEYQKPARGIFALRGDSLEILTRIKTGSVDMVMTDPPYRVSSDTVIVLPNRKIVYDFGEWDKFDSERAFKEFTKVWVTECARVLKDGGVFVSFFGKSQVTWMFEILRPLGFRDRDIFVLVKSNPVPQFRKVKFSQATEFAVILTKDEKKGVKSTFNFDLGQHPNYAIVPVVGGTERVKAKDGVVLHPTQKPLSVTKLLISYLSPKGGLVLDPFGGTGTTAVAAYELGRRCVIIEKEKKYYDSMFPRLLLSRRIFV